MSIFEIYESKESRKYPKLEFRDECMRILKEAEKTDSDWILVGQEAPTDDVLINILTKRTELKNPFWIKALQKGLGYNNIKEMMGDESN